jgi:hypothetical protein
MAAPNPVDVLPPEARFALRAVAAGLPIDEAGSVLRLDGPTVRKHLRTAVRRLGGSVVSPQGGYEELMAALGPALEAGRVAPVRAPSTPCPAPDVADALAAGALDGPLMLAEAEHAADCPTCLARLVAARKAGIAAPPPAHVAVRPMPALWPLVVATAAGIALAAWFLLVR